MTTTQTPSPTVRPPAGAPPPNVFARLARAQSIQIVLVLVMLVAGFSAAKPQAFLSVDNFRNIAVNVSILALLGVGMTFVIITAGIDLSVGSVLVFSGVVSSKAMVAAGGDGWRTASVGIVVAILCGAGWGMVNGLLITKTRVPALIVTLGTLGMALGFAQIISGGIDSRDIAGVMVDTVGFGRLFGQIPTLTLIALAIVVLGAVVLHRTRFGLYTYAVGSSPEAARRSGVGVDRQLIAVYTISGTLAGLAGILSLSFYQSTTIAGHSTDNLNAIAAVVIGGTSLFGGAGTIIGTVIGLFIPAVLQNGFIILGVSSFWQQVVVGAVLIAAVYVDQARRAAATRPRRRRPPQRTTPVQNTAPENTASRTTAP